MSSYTFKTAPIGERVTVSIGEGRIIVANAKNGEPKRSLALAGIKGGRWVETGLRYYTRPSTTDRRLTLHGDGGKLMIRCGATTPDPKLPNMAQFLGAAAEALEAAAAENPGLEIDIGPAGAARLVIFLIGAMCLLIGVFFVLGALFTIIGPDWIQALVFLGFGAVAIGSGFSMAAGYNIFRKPERIDALALAADIRAR